jgi:hypothetical protein
LSLPQVTVSSCIPKLYWVINALRGAEGHVA